MIQTKRPKICILAVKDLSNNSRVARQARILDEAGYDVTILALQNFNRKFIPKNLSIKIFSWPIDTYIKKNYRRFIAHRKRDSNISSFPIILKNQPTILASNQTNMLHLKTRSIFILFYFYLITILFSFWAARRILSNNFSILQAHDSYALIPVVLFQKLRRVKIVYDAVEIHADRSGEAFRYLPNLIKKTETQIYRKLIRDTDLIISVCNGYAESLKKHYHASNIKVVRNCSLYQNCKEIDNALIKEACGLKQNKKLGIIVGNVYRGSGILNVIQSIPYLQEHIHIAILGFEKQIGYFNQLIETAEDLSVRHRLHLLKPVPANDVVNYISGADFGIIAIRPTSENHKHVLPNKLFEMVMARLPIIASNMPELQKLIVRYKIGACFKAGDVKSLARKIDQVLHRENYTTYVASTDKAAAILNWENESKMYIKYLSSVL